MKKFSIAFGLSLLAVLLLGEGGAVAQQVTAVITGQVTDPSGSPIVGASVQARDIDRGTTEKTTTNVDGIYNFPRLPVGTYEVRVETKGFQSAVRPPFQLQLNQTARMDFAMQIGQVNETVEVTGAAPLLQTETTALGSVIDSRANEDLPLGARNYVQLTLLAAGAVTPNPHDFTNGSSTGFSPTSGGSRPYINGNHEQANNFLLDGVDNNQVSDNLIGYSPIPDAIQEFNMITQNASAEFGNFEGGIINATIKSGTNQWHGDAFEFFRNDKLNANSWENNWTDSPKPTMRWNQYGGTMGGPIKKDKLFIFGDYQGFRYDIPTSVGWTTLFTAAERNGDFSALLTAATPYQLKNPFNLGTNGQPMPFSGNIIPLGLIDPVAKALFASSDYPAPQNGNLINNYSVGSATITNQKQGDVKVDYVLSDKDRLFGRYSRLYANDPTTTTFQLDSNGFIIDNAHNGVLNWTRTISPSIVNEARAGLNYLLVNNGDDPQGIGNFGQQLGIANANVGGPGLISLGFNNGYVAGFGNSISGNQQLFASTVIQADDNLIITKGRHVIKTGFEVMRERINIYYASNSGNLGFISYNGQYSGTGESDFFLGLPYQFGKGGGLTGTWGQRSTVWAGFVNDDFHVNDSLTLNLGLRYENHTPWVEVDNRQANFGITSGTVYLAGKPCPWDNCQALYNSHNGGLDFQPRVGFAYAPKLFQHKTVFRGAYTVSSYLEGTGTNLRLPLNPPLNQAETLVTYSAPNYTTGKYVLPATTTDQGLILPPPGDPFAGATLRVWDQIQPAIVQQWSFSIQHQFNNTTTLQASYVGQHGTHLMEPLELSESRLNPDGTISPTPYLAGNSTLVADVMGNGGIYKGTESVGNQKYNALQMVLQKRMSNGLEAQVAYTYSKCMTDNGGYYGSWGAQAGFGPTYWQNLYDQKSEWGECFFDEKSVLTTNAIYEVPFGRNRRFGKGMNPVVNAVAGNWNVSGILTIKSGFPTTPFLWGDESGTGNFFYTRADCVAPAKIINQPYAAGGIQWFDPSSYTTPAAGTFGTCGNSVVRGPGSAYFDMSLMKDFVLTERKKLQLRSDFINATNSVVLNSPSASLGGGMGTITSSQGPRNIQLALKFYF